MVTKAQRWVAAAFSAFLFFVSAIAMSGGAGIEATICLIAGMLLTLWALQP